MPPSQCKQQLCAEKHVNLTQLHLPVYAHLHFKFAVPVPKSLPTDNLNHNYFNWKTYYKYTIS